MTAHIQSWQECLNIIKKNVELQSYKTWFEPIKSISFKNDVLTVQVPNKFFYEWLEEHYLNVLKTSVKSIFGNKASLEYQILMDENVDNSHSNLSESTILNQAETIRNPFVIPGIKKLKIDSQLNANYKFDNFIEGECNKLARSAGLNIAQKPGGNAFSPLVIYGDVGLGKTHLSQAIGNAVVENNPNKQALYVTVEQFTNQVIQAIKNNSVTDFINFYQMVDVLIVDDIQFLANRPKTQEIFFNIFNQLHQNGKQIILTSDRAPKDLNEVESRLISRFKWGLTAELESPDMATRMSILDQKINNDNITLSEEVREFICYNLKSNIRELEGVLISLMAQATLTKRKIDIKLAKDVISQFVTINATEISVENIKKLVADHFKMPVDKLQSPTRKRAVVIARQLSMYLAKAYTNSSLKSIGSNFGGRDHSTVLYSLQAVKDMMDTDLIFKDTVSELEKKLQMTLQAT
jgi:chromosomal replication initiator protein